MDIIVDIDYDKPCPSCGEPMQVSSCWPTKMYEYNWSYDYCRNQQCENYWGKVTK